MPKNKKKISLAQLKNKMKETKEPGSPPQRRRGRSRERRDPSLASRGSSCSRGSSVYDDHPMDVEAVFEALFSCRDVDDVLLSTTLFEQGILPEYMDWAVKAFEALVRKNAKKGSRKSVGKK